MRNNDEMPSFNISDDFDLSKSREAFSLLVNSFIMEGYRDTKILDDIIDFYKDYFNDTPVTRKQLAKILAVYAYNIALDIRDKKVHEHNIDQALTIIQKRIDRNFKVLDKGISLIPKNKEDIKNSIIILSISGIIIYVVGDLMLQAVTFMSSLISNIKFW